MAKRNKKKHDDHIDESWLLPYADILTLLLALFIVLFAMSSVDAQKFQQLSQVFNTVFVGEKGILEQGELPPGEAPSTEIPTKKEDEQNKDKKDQQFDYSLQEQEELTKVKERVDKYIDNNKLADEFDTKLTNEGLLITIGDNALFGSGSADVRNSDKKTAKKLANLLFMDPQREVVISGHTDNIPIKNSEYDSNWDLSVSRAVNFMKLILENKKLDPRSFSAKGSGEYQPIASNKTKEGREKNRRVEILVLPITQKAE
ncbi:flagellar motor protein MotB [Aciduricibacillus chroicocephali]|uniref:Flagellar motor protein MotB n=1 Tax=Aciduricibacillus chroicocephali TaxID=3054939 RepID=A0ABY9KU19_9BACI|nr:flagellar motor protein MotB [Bacillaceae bacterium 44XB]